jgi:hypothetical protein
MHRSDAEGVSQYEQVKRIPGISEDDRAFYVRVIEASKEGIIEL